MQALLLRALSNKHTSAAGAIYFLAKIVMPILKVWLPSYVSQLDQTEKILEGGAVAYGLLMAGDAGKSATKEDLKAVTEQTATAIKTGDTTVLSKPKDTP